MRTKKVGEIDHNSLKSFFSDICKFLWKKSLELFLDLLRYGLKRLFTFDDEFLSDGTPAFGQLSCKHIFR